MSSSERQSVRASEREMSDDEIRIACAELCFWCFEFDDNKWAFRVSNNGRYVCDVLAIGAAINFTRPSLNDIPELPDYQYSLHAMAEARRLRINSVALRVKYLNALREVVGRRLPKNKAGVPIVTDYDLLDASAGEHAEAFLKALDKGRAA